MSARWLALAAAAALPLAAQAQAPTQPQNQAPGTPTAQGQATEQQQVPRAPGAPAQAQDQQAATPAAQRRVAWVFTPSIGLTETWSDNPRLLVESVPVQSGWITTVTPGLALEHRGPRLRITADYRYQHDFYSEGAGPDDSRNFLNALASYDLVERRFSIEGRANITQERLSAFGSAVIPDAPGGNENRVETRILGVSPVLRGSWGDIAEYVARANASRLRAEGAIETDTFEALATLRSAAPAARLGWSADVSALSTRSESQATLQDFRARAALVYAPMSQVHLSLIAGYEDSDFAPEDERRRATPGIGIEWSPGPRTQFAAIAQDRWFGTGHLATLRHRSSRTIWDVRSRRTAETMSSSISGGALTLENLMADLLAASIPDPAARAEAVRRRLAEFGSQPTTLGQTFLTERPYLISAVDATVALLGSRNTLTFTGLRQTQTALLTSQVTDSFTDSTVIRTHSYSANWTYALTPLTSLTASTSRLRSVGLDAGSPTTNQELDTIYLSTRLGPRTTASVGVRRVVFDSTVQAENYKENAVFGSISFRL